ncbi:unnamed protein product [Nippostrongylus brasiliensis]|uniref:NAC domain-containing protein n=1 Tax=Nippostrongylus brasiliensis TaxID=27835 RepID=A0A0N4XJC2_NIPBR|nr:unnamed protein product [Nippostrongylus brasiliensis]
MPSSRSSSSSSSSASNGPDPLYYRGYHYRPRIMGNYLLFELINFELEDSDNDNEQARDDNDNQEASDDEITYPSGLFPVGPGGPPLFLILPLPILYGWLRTNPTLLWINNVERDNRDSDSE